MDTPVLIVDDDDTIRVALRWALEDEGYIVYEVPDGQAALVHLSEHPTSMVVLLDVAMPGMDGIALMQVLAAQASLAERHAYIIMTGHKRTLPMAFVQQLIRRGAPVMSKPFDLDDLLVAVATVAQRLADAPG